MLGIDPGFANTGYGVVEARAGRLSVCGAGTITTAPGQPLAERLAALFRDVDALLAEYRPSAVALEELYFGQNASSAMVVGQARGVVLAAAGLRGVPATGFTPQQVKQAVCGSGRADKDQVARMVRSRLGLADGRMPDHASDALAVALCHIDRAPLAKRLAVAS